MKDSTGGWQRPGKGRPRIEDRAEILVHFARELDAGRSVSEIARSGLNIWGQRLAADGRTRTLYVLRSYTGPTLERRYREFLQEVERSVACGAGATIVLDGIAKGSWMSQRPLSFPQAKAVRRGRPAKKRAS